MQFLTLNLLQLPSGNSYLEFGECIVHAALVSPGEEYRAFKNDSIDSPPCFCTLLCTATSFIEHFIFVAVVE